MIVPRYSPTYSFRDLKRAWALSQDGVPSRELERQLGDLYGARHVWVLNTARAALYVLLRAYARRGEVVVPAYNCIVVPEAVVNGGYVPVFCDIDLRSLNMTPATLERCLSPRTVAVLATHQFGNPCQIEEIVEICRAKGLLVVEDAAAALGATHANRLVGTFGDAAIVSFGMTKVIAGVTGGALMTNDDDLALKVRRFLNGIRPGLKRSETAARALAWKAATLPGVYKITQQLYHRIWRENLYEIVTPSTGAPSKYSTNMSEFAAALVLLQLSRLDANLRRRRELVTLYTDELSKTLTCKLPYIEDTVAPAWIQFPVRVVEKSHFYQFMKHKGIDLSWTFRYSCAESYSMSGYPNALCAANSVLGFPTYPSLQCKQAKEVSSLAMSYVASYQEHHLPI
jgi:dTDP-4-amino-4,6-dideoxygalactose transaminase